MRLIPLLVLAYLSTTPSAQPHLTQHHHQHEKRNPSSSYIASGMELYFLASRLLNGLSINFINDILRVRMETAVEYLSGPGGIHGRERLTADEFRAALTQKVIADAEGFPKEELETTLTEVRTVYALHLTEMRNALDRQYTTLQISTWLRMTDAHEREKREMVLQWEKEERMTVTRKAVRYVMQYSLTLDEYRDNYERARGLLALYFGTIQKQRDKFSTRPVPVPEEAEGINVYIYNFWIAVRTIPWPHEQIYNNPDYKPIMIRRIEEDRLIRNLDEGTNKVKRLETDLEMFYTTHVTTLVQREKERQREGDKEDDKSDLPHL